MPLSASFVDVGIGPDNLTSYQFPGFDFGPSGHSIVVCSSRGFGTGIPVNVSRNSDTVLSVNQESVVGISDASNNQALLATSGGQEDATVVWDSGQLRMLVQSVSINQAYEVKEIGSVNLSAGEGSISINSYVDGLVLLSVISNSANDTNISGAVQLASHTSEDQIRSTLATIAGDGTEKTVTISDVSINSGWHATALSLSPAANLISPRRRRSRQRNNAL